MALFLSTYNNKLDKKGRVSVPALFRAALVHPEFSGVVVFRSPKYAALEAMGIDRMAALSQSTDTLDLFSETRDDITAAIFADAHPLTLDPEGRILIPPVLIVHAKINEQVAFVGRGPTFQIWNPDIFALYQDEARQRLQKEAHRIKLNLIGGSF